MKKSFLLLVLSVSAQLIHAQAVNFEWAKAIGGKSNDQGHSLVVDQAGDIYSTGYFSGKVDFDPGKDTAYITSNGSFDIYILKVDNKGAFVWAKSIGGTGKDQGNSIALDTFGNIHLTGSFESSVDFDPGSGTSYLVSNGGSDIFICQLNKSGQFVWANNMGGDSDDNGNSIVTSASGTIYTTGYFQDTAYFNSTDYLIASGGLDAYVSVYDPSGNLQSLHQMTGPGDEAGNAITLDTRENIFITGYFNDQVDFDPLYGPYYMKALGDADVFILKLDASVYFSWVVPLAGKGYDCGNSIVVSSSGDVYATGVFSTTADFDPSPKGTANLTSAGGTDIFISKLNSSGSYVWARQIGGTNDDQGLTITLDGSGEIYNSGGFQSRVDFDPGSSTYYFTAIGSDDIYILKLNASGNFVWAKQMGGTNSDLGHSISVNASKSVFLTGSFDSHVDFDPGKDSTFITSKGSLDIFLHKMVVCTPTKAKLKANACYSYALNGTTYNNTGIYYQQFTNKDGCDSILTLELTINTTTIGNLVVIACKSYTINGITYTTSGTYNQTLKNTNGCDSILVLEITFGDNKSNFSAKACDKYTWNTLQYIKSGTYIQILKNKAGCDSTVTLKLTILKSTSAVVNALSCDSYTLAGSIYTASGTYIKKIKNNADCDSTITLNLVIKKSTSSNLIMAACESLTLNSQTFTKSGIYNQTIPNKVGCDSNISLNLSINKSSSTITHTACKNFLLNGKLYTQSGAYNQIVNNSKGCDSSITLKLTINTVNKVASQIGALLTANAIDAGYQWLDCNNGFIPIPGQNYRDFLVKKSGNYAVKVTENSCSDTSNCFNVNFNSVQKNKSSGVYVFPNPVNDKLTILFHRVVNSGNLVLTNTSGQVIYTLSNISGEQAFIDVSSYPIGLYFMESNIDGSVSRIKIQKK